MSRNVGRGQPYRGTGLAVRQVGYGVRSGAAQVPAGLQWPHAFLSVINFPTTFALAEKPCWGIRRENGLCTIYPQDSLCIALVYFVGLFVFENAHRHRPQAQSAFYQRVLRFSFARSANPRRSRCPLDRRTVIRRINTAHRRCRPRSRPVRCVWSKLSIPHSGALAGDRMARFRRAILTDRACSVWARSFR